MSRGTLPWRFMIGLLGVFILVLLVADWVVGQGVGPRSEINSTRIYILLAIGIITLMIGFGKFHYHLQSQS